MKSHSFYAVRRAWLSGRPIMVSVEEVRNIIVKGKTVERKVKAGADEVLSPGGIYSIYSEREKYGTGKSQFAQFLMREYETEYGRKATKYHVFSAGEYNELSEKLKKALTSCDRKSPVFFFIDEVDLMISPNMEAKEKTKRLERFGNILIGVADKAYFDNLPFHIFLILSKKIQEAIDAYVSDRWGRRITSLMRVDISLEKKNFENFFTNLFAVLWLSNHKGIKEKVNSSYEFKGLMGELISNFVEKSHYMGLEEATTVVGELVKTYREILDQIFSGLREKQVNEAYKILANERKRGNLIEKFVKDYLKENRAYRCEKEGHTIKVQYQEDSLVIGKHKTDGYYEFRIGDNKIGNMLVEITSGKTLAGHNKAQLEDFADQCRTLLIWTFTDKQTTEDEIEAINEKTVNDVESILIPRDLAQYSLLLKKGNFRLLEEVRKGMLGDIRTFLYRHAQGLFNQWMMEQPITPTTTPALKEPSIPSKTRGKKASYSFKRIEKREERFFENIFEFLDEKTRRSHKKMKEQTKQQLSSLNSPFQEFDITIPLSKVNRIYKEIVEKLDEEQLCHYNKIKPNSYLMKGNGKFSVKRAIKTCKGILSSRIKNKLQEKSISLSP